MTVLRVLPREEIEMYKCLTCGERVSGSSAARKHAKQGHKSQREAWYAGELHSLELEK